MSVIKGRELNTCGENYVVFDLETTGFSVKNQNVVEIAALKVKDGKPVKKLYTLTDPEIYIPKSATDVHGITNDMVKGMPPFYKVLPQFFKFTEGLPLVGHNIASFDMKFVERDTERYLDLDIENDYVDTLKLARKVLPDLKSKKLIDLAEYFGIQVDVSHRAMDDCFTNQKVFEELKKIKLPGTEEQISMGLTEKICPACGRRMALRTGKYGKFWGCKGYPYCKHTENISHLVDAREE